MAAPQAVAPMAPPRAAPTEMSHALPGVAAPRMPAPDYELPPVGSPLTPAYGTPPVHRASVPVAPAPTETDPLFLDVLGSTPAPDLLPQMDDLPVEAPAHLEPPHVELTPARMEPPAVARPQGPLPGVALKPRTPTTPGVDEVHARPASLWRRVLSFSVDTAAIGAVAAAYITLASSVAGVKAPHQVGLTGLDAFVAWLRALHAVLLPGVVLMLVLATVYCAVAAILWNGRTLGRLLLGLRLVDTHGLAPAPGRAILRAMLASLSFFLFLGGFWMALFDRRGQTLHDKLTSTFVVQPS
ncbi:RDD family protein [Corallococcus sp. H22C18031201]|nr:RDD family protein [Corallococcus sp. H22C18031201]